MKLVTCLLCALLVLAGCDGDGPMPTASDVPTPSPVPAVPSPDGPLWILNTLDGSPVLEDAIPTLVVDGNRYWGRDGCNSIVGKSHDEALIAKPDGSIRFGPYGGTDMGCITEGVEAQAERYGKALLDSRRYRLDDDRLELFDGMGLVRLAFMRNPPIPGRPVAVVGTRWLFLPGESEVGGEDEFTIEFLDKRLVVVNTLCGSYVLRYRTRGQNEVGFELPNQVEFETPCLGDYGEWWDPAVITLFELREYAGYEEGGEAHLIMRTYLGRAGILKSIPAHGDELFDGEWVLWAFGEFEITYLGVILGMETAGVLQGTNITASFRPDGIRGGTGCGSYDYSREGGPMIRADGAISTDKLVSSVNYLCMGSPQAFSQDRRYFETLRRLEGFHVSGSFLILYADDDHHLIFRRQAAH